MHASVYLSVCQPVGTRAQIIAKIYATRTCLSLFNHSVCHQLLHLTLVAMHSLIHMHLYVCQSPMRTAMAAEMNDTQALMLSRIEVRVDSACFGIRPVRLCLF